jgi:hypothetical protein
VAEIRHKMFDGLPGASCPQPDLFKGFAADEIGADAVKNHRGAQSDLFEAAAIGNPDECAAQYLANSPDIFVTVRRGGFEKINGVTTFRMPQIVLNSTEIAPVHGRDYRRNNKPGCP